MTMIDRRDEICYGTYPHTIFTDQGTCLECGDWTLLDATEVSDLIVDTLIYRLGYDEVREGLYDWTTNVIGYSTDMVGEKQGFLPFNRVVTINRRDLTVRIENPATRDETTYSFVGFFQAVKEVVA